MPYRFTENKDYSDYASGRVFYAVPGHPALPVRLVSEVFQHCQALRQKMGLTSPVVLYDPCCGSAYHLSVLAYLHWYEIDTIIGSDIDAAVLAAAARNLSLLTPTGLEKRAQEITEMFERHGKSSHREAAKSVKQFQQQLQAHQSTHQISTRLFTADVTHKPEIAGLLSGQQIDVVLADIPYGQQSNWRSSTDDQIIPDKPMLEKMLDALLGVLSGHTVVAIVADKSQKCVHPQYQRRGRFQVGKRQVALLQPG